MTAVPQDLSDTRSVLEYLYKITGQMQDIQMQDICMELLSEYEKTFNEPDESDKKKLPYNRKDAYSILEYLKLQAESLSEGRWTDFSDSDIGTVFLKLISYLADMNNFQTDKTASELYLDTALERSSAISLAALVGYEPRHYLAPHCTIRLGVNENKNVPDGTVIPAYSIFTNSSSTIQYCNLEDQYYYNQYSKFEVYQGNPVSNNFTISDIDSLGRIVLDSYNVATNTFRLSIDGVEYKQVEDVRYTTGNLCFSLHIHEDKYLYIQLPSFWPDVITQGSVIKVRYLVTAGEDGRIGRNILTKMLAISSDYYSSMIVEENTPSEGGYNPETVDEMRNSVPAWARTMNTIVTINDFEEVGMNISGISDIKALDYNDKVSGLIQPDDYYKVYLYVLPDATQYDATDSDLIKYRNTILKAREDWTVQDMSNVAKDKENFAKSSILGNTITLTNAASIYGTNVDYSESDVYRCLYIINNAQYTPTPYELQKYDLDNDGVITSEDAEAISDIILHGNYLDNATDNIVLGVDVHTNNEDDDYLVELVDDVSGITDRFVYQMDVVGTDVVITMNSNWREMIDDSDRLIVYFKEEQVLTEVGQQLREYIDERRLCSLNVSFHDLEIVQPTLVIDVFMDKNNLRFNSVATEIKEFVLDRFSREHLKIGEPLFDSVIGSAILNNFPFLRYCEVREPEEKVEVVPKGFIDIVPNVLENGVLVDKIIVNVYDYQNRQI